MANWPPVDPTDPAEPSSSTTLENRATGFTYEPGSTFKAFTVAAALEDKHGHPEHDLLPADRAPRRRPDDRPTPRHAATETLTVAQILAQSSNVGAVDDRPRRSGPKHFNHWIHRFGFGAPTGIEFPGEEQGIVPPLDAVLGLDDGQPADRPGPLGDADADGRRLLGDRQRRHPAPAAADR